MLNCLLCDKDLKWTAFMAINDYMQNSNAPITVFQFLQSISKFKKLKSKNLPQYACTDCYSSALQAFNFQTLCNKTAEKLMTNLKYNESDEVLIDFDDIKVEEITINHEFHDDSNEIDTVNRNHLEDDVFDENQLHEEVDIEDDVKEEFEDEISAKDEQSLEEKGSVEIINQENNKRVQSNEEGDDSAQLIKVKICDENQSDEEEHTSLQILKNLPKPEPTPDDLKRQALLRQKKRKKQWRNTSVECSKCKKMIKRGSMPMHKKVHMRVKPDKSKLDELIEEAPKLQSIIRDLPKTDNSSEILKQEKIFQKVPWGSVIVACKICKKKIQRDSLTKHLKVHTGERRRGDKSKIVKLDIDPKDAFEIVEKTEETLKELAERKEGNMPCPVCHRKMSSYKLREHMLVHGIDKYKCESCHKSFKYLADYKTHMQSHDFMTTLCKVCKVNFDNTDDLREHAKLHPEYYPYTCEYVLDVSITRRVFELSNTDLNEFFLICGKKSKNKRGHTLHMNGVHARLICKVCKVRFASKGLLMKHKCPKLTEDD